MPRVSYPEELRQAKLASLAAAEGFETPDELVEAASFDSVSPGICTEAGCNYTMEVEPDQDRGWCENCRKGTVASTLILAGII